MGAAATGDVGRIVISGYGREEFPIFGTKAVIQTIGVQHLGIAVETVQRVLAAVDAACSRFRDDSEISRLNDRDGLPTVMSSDFLAALAVAMRAAEISDGVVDPTIGANLRVLGYDRDFYDVDRIGAGVVTLQRNSNWRDIKLDTARSAVTLPRGVALDFGATAKAWAADHAADAAAAATETGVMVSLGGDLAIAGAAPQGGWVVQLADSHAATPSAQLPTVALESGGLATSSTSVRRWTRGPRDFHHILDPATGEPAIEYWRTVSVAAATCVDANIASTTAIIRGACAVEWLETTGLATRLVAIDGSVTYCNGWPLDAAVPR